MRDISSFSKIYIAIKPEDFRKHAHGLAMKADLALGIPLNSEKVLTVFTNKRKRSIKLVYWDGTGYAMWWKTLEKDKFRWPKSESEAKLLTAKELKWLLEGVDLSRIKTHKKLEF